MYHLNISVFVYRNKQNFRKFDIHPIIIILWCNGIKGISNIRSVTL